MFAKKQIFLILQENVKTKLTMQAGPQWRYKIQKLKILLTTIYFDNKHT